MEACGPCGWISDLCEELGLMTFVCSTNEDAKIADPPARPTRFHDDDVNVFELEDFGEVLALSRSHDKLLFTCLGVEKTTHRIELTEV